jgi:hypothetical protein
MSARKLLAVALLATGCTSLFENGKQPVALCQNDSDCGRDEVCFVDGCGDPGKDIAVEVTPSASDGPYAQDFAVDELEGNQTLQLFATAHLAGNVQRDQDTGGPVPYTSPVTVVASGQSQLIPGLFRHYEATFTPLDGRYSLPVGSGAFSVAAVPSDLGLPPLFSSELDVSPGHDTGFDLTFPRPGELATLGGQLQLSDGSAPTVSLRVQAVDGDGRPLSQAVPVAPTGDFTLTVQSAVLDAAQITLKVSPVDTLAPVPEVSFAVRPLDPLGTLVLADVGAPVGVKGLLRSPSGAPIAGASVHLEGPVEGGGFFRSQIAQTDDGGSFELQSLPSAGLTLLAVPPAGTAAGLLQTTVAIDGGTDLGGVSAPARIEITGTVRTPDGAPASGVTVIAEPLAALDGNHPLPPSGDQATTDGDANFSLLLDPAQYRIDLVPGDKLARTSRYVTIDPAQAPGGQQALAPFVLSLGRSVNGHIEILGADGGSGRSAALARVRFYRRIALEDGGTSSVLLDQAYADQSGSYTVLLPTR